MDTSKIDTAIAYCGPLESFYIYATATLPSLFHDDSIDDIEKAYWVWCDELESVSQEVYQDGTK
ncbi:MAG: hypothetical protein LUC37_06805 [Prevotella sp.]|nr:hypothetical protein [Prevotella sp.]